MKPSLLQLLRWAAVFAVFLASGDLASSRRVVEPRLVALSVAFDTATAGRQLEDENGGLTQGPSATETGLESETSALADSPAPSIVEGPFGFTCEVSFDSEESVVAPRSTLVGRLRRSVAQARAPPSASWTS